MTTSRRHFCIHFRLFCVLTIICVCQLGYWSFRSPDWFQCRWVIKTGKDSSTSPFTSAPNIRGPSGTPTTSTPSSSHTTSPISDDDDDDGCRLTSHPNNIHWTRKPENEYDVQNSNSYTVADADAVAADADDAAVQERIRQVQQCAAQFPLTYVTSPSDSDWWSSMLCNVGVTNELVQAVAQKHNNILFVGDSVMRQQYVILLCMIDPTLEHMQLLDGKDSQFRFRTYYQRPDGNVTSLFYEGFGHGWSNHEHQNTLYNGSFPRAIETYTKQDAIVLNANSHYNANSVKLLIHDMHFLAQQAARSNGASVYLMEPSPNEWPTGNGFNIRECQQKKTCRCEALTAERLLGRDPYPENIQRLVDSQNDHVSTIKTTVAAGIGTTIQEEQQWMTLETNNATYSTGRQNIPPFWNDLLQVLKEQRRHRQGDANVLLPEATHHSKSNHHPAAAEPPPPCEQECFPATWKSDVIRSILLNNNKSQASSPPPQQQQQQQQHISFDSRPDSTTPAASATVVHVVPSFLQVAMHHGHSSVKNIGDCTHRALDALIMFNEQLIRTMLMVHPNLNNHKYSH